MLAGQHSSIAAQTSRRLTRCLVDALWSRRPLLASCLRLTLPPVRLASSSSTRWLSRQGRDPHTRASKLSGLKSRAAFKLLEIDEKHHLFKPGQTVVDLGYAPGSWSQVAISRVKPGGQGLGRVVGIDVIPAQPPRGVSSLQGDFLSPAVQKLLRDFVRDQSAGRASPREQKADGGQAEAEETMEEDETAGQVVDVVLSDMNEPWPIAISWANSVSDPYRRMMNTSGNAFKDHVGSMDLCMAALSFSYDTLVHGGHFLCKFYQGNEEKAYENRLKALFEKVHRVKPDSSRKESREAYFLGLRRKANVTREDVFSDQ